MRGANGNGNGPVPVPAGAGRVGNGHSHGQSMRGMGFEGARSPPNGKSTSHVPCKFYRQGACQAGKACPFLHSDEPFAERAPCKYFTKGNCKFGAKCALAHILPNGHVVNRNHMGGSQFGRVNLPHHADTGAGSSLLTMQAHMSPMQSQYPGSDEYFGGQKPQYDMIPTIDTTFSSHPGSNYGSPPEGGRLPISPGQKGLSVMDVQLPASFDSQGISHMARYGPIASSVPAKFLANSPPSSYQGDSPALRNLRDSAFGDDSRSRAAALGSSPPESIEQPLGRRIMHSQMGASRKGMISASVGARPPMAINDDWDEGEIVGHFERFEEELLPGSLGELLTPQEKMRRFSRDQGDENGLSHRQSLSRLGASPPGNEPKVGSLSAATSSPSRFQSLWGKPNRPSNGEFESGSPGASAFGHVGSPLRNSSLHPGASPALRAMSRPTSGDASPFLSSPPRQASMSMISQQLQRTRLSSRASEEGMPHTGNPIHPGMTRVTSGSSIGSSSGRLGMDRAVSSSSIGRERIDEEQGLFSMEEEEELDRGKPKDGASTASGSSNKRHSGLSWGSAGKGSPNIAPIGGHRTSGLHRDAGPWGNPS
ncbi:hypothetical protein P154DRAFT_419145 [Amniculicola lignicola CBS 123094]|uniref:C3H1-type domain-containing protein n=1 Tax=Amniculicola lignicola CBS 123094 TaxID=1392246 RepID=A0A6A5X4N8_9PLEO|nr:hypothetical protein P154DRAFT_419145 [Amniculicola lignicola CBS 123094]